MPPSARAFCLRHPVKFFFCNCDRPCHIGVLNCGQTSGENLPKTRTKEADMTRQIAMDEFCDCYEYHGGTTIAYKRTQDGETVWKDWILFDSVEEASEYFNAAAN
jgi:hypothetical protein